MELVNRGRLLFPADAVRARRYAVSNLTTLHARSSRLAAAVGRAGPGATTTRASDGRPPLDPEVLEALGEIPARREWLLLGDYDGSRRSRSILFLFDSTAHPSEVVKVRRLDGEGESLRLEAEALTGLRLRSSSAIATTIPEVRRFDTTLSHEILALSGLPGQPLSRLLQASVRGSAAQGDRFVAVGRWLGAMQRESRDTAGSVTVHGDYWPRNVLFEGERVSGVVDWEGSSPAGPPDTDLFMMAILFHATPPVWSARELPQSLVRAFAGREAGVTRRYLEAWCDATGNDFASLRSRFEHFAAEIDQRKEKKEWQNAVPWGLLRRLAAGRSVFSG